MPTSLQQSPEAVSDAINCLLRSSVLTYIAGKPLSPKETDVGPYFSSHSTRVYSLLLATPFVCTTLLLHCSVFVHLYRTFLASRLFAGISSLQACHPIPHVAPNHAFLASSASNVGAVFGSNLLSQ